MIGNHPPKSPGVRRSDRFSLIEDGGASMNQWGIDDVRMSDHPAYIGSGPINFSGIGVEDRLHAVFQCNCMAAIFTNHSLWQPSCSGSVENIKWIGSINWHRVRRICRGHQLIPVKVPSCLHGGIGLGSLKQNDVGKRIICNS